MNTNNHKLIKECEICGTNATCLCYICKSYFCESCYKLIHDKKINSNHKKENIDPFVPIDLKCPDHPEHPMYLFCVDEKGKLKTYLYFLLEICCTCCYYDNLHSDHKLIKLSDIESLKKENITIETTLNEYNENSKKVNDLKNKIENEINQINKLYEKTIDDLTKSYIKKHEELVKQENDLKEKLQNEVTKVKEQLEKFLSESNYEIKISEKINKGIKNLDKEEKNIIKNLLYISRINKSQKNMKKLFQELMKNLKFSYQEDKSNITYEEYYFNGIPYPKNIKFNDISTSSLKISWDIDNINIIILYFQKAY